MQLYTLNRGFIRQDIIDRTKSIIWTERYYGDSAVEVVAPATMEMIEKLSLGTFLALDESDEIMILESMSLDNGEVKVSGISILPWMNNRFVRTSANHEDKHWPLEAESAGWAVWAILYYMCCEGSPYLNGTNPTGIPNPEKLVIPGLGNIDYDKSGGPLTLSIPYGPVYAAMREVATTHEIGMTITLEEATETSYSLGFRSYKGLNRTTAPENASNSVIRFSPQMESFTDIKEIQSIAALKTLVYSFAPGLKEEGQATLTGAPGVSSLTGPQYTGFDLRALQVFADDISTDKVGGDAHKVLEMLNNKALDELTNNHFVKSVDGEIVPDSQFKYGVHYFLGDIIEVEGNMGVVQPARITEYIRSQDSSGEKEYPTVTMID